MRSVIQLDINAPQPLVSALFMDPANAPKWMHDLARIEFITGESGEPGSTYRMVPKRNDRVFVATVLAKEPERSQLSLDSPTATVAITATFRKLVDSKTQLVSEEIFRFKGLVATVLGFVAMPAIKRAHRRHIQSFKRFAETYRYPDARTSVGRA
jgi:hypothetical protein